MIGHHTQKSIHTHTHTLKPIIEISDAAAFVRYKSGAEISTSKPNTANGVFLDFPLILAKFWLERPGIVKCVAWINSVNLFWEFFL